MRCGVAFFLMIVLLISAGCASAPPSEARFSWKFYSSPTISPETFSGQSVAILPTVSIEYDPTQEIYRETLAGLLYTALIKYSDGPRILSLDVLESSINKKELWNEFKLMYSEYQKTAVLRKDLLSQIGQAADARYVILPRLLRFQSETFDRATILGIAFLRTRQSSVDIHAQIWDTVTGEVVWEGASEGTIASEVVRGRPASFMAVAENACESLASKMPWVKSEKK
ncbi:MAG: hypothetical protein ACM3MD_10370 [Betaproteobacteria bacterium]